METIKCPECGNSERFYLSYECVRFEVTRYGDKYVGTLDDRNGAMLWCANCGTQFDPDDADQIDRVVEFSL